MPSTKQRPLGRDWTAAMARALPADGNRYEVLDGELCVTPAPTADHQEALTVLFRLLDPYVREHRIGHVWWSPADIEFSPRRLVQPDLFVAPLIEGKRPRKWGDIHGLVLAIETLSPTTARADRTVKSRIYMEEDVGEYWIVDLDARVFERWRKGESRPEILSDTLGWQPQGVCLGRRSISQHTSPKCWATDSQCQRHDEHLRPTKPSLPKCFATSEDSH